MPRKPKHTKVKNKQKQKQKQQQTVVVNINHPTRSKSRRKSQQAPCTKSSNVKSNMPLHHTFYLDQEPKERQQPKERKESQGLHAPNNTIQPLHAPNNTIEPLGSNIETDTNPHFIPDAPLHYTLPSREVNIEPYYRYDDEISLDSTIPDDTSTLSHLIQPYLTENSNPLNQHNMTMSTSSLMIPNEHTPITKAEQKELDKYENKMTKKMVKELIQEKEIEMKAIKKEERDRENRERGLQRQRELAEANITRKDIKNAKKTAKDREAASKKLVADAKTDLLNRGVNRDLINSIIKYTVHPDDLKKREQQVLKMTKQEVAENARNHKKKGAKK